MTGEVAIITGASQGIGAGLVAGYRGRGWAVVAIARTIKPSEDPDTPTVDGDLADPATADRIVGAALERFGRIDTLVNNAGVFISKPFTDYTAADYATVVTDQRQAVDAVERTVAELGRLDTVVNNAGVMLLGPLCRPGCTGMRLPVRPV
jgi:NADP-dependent 3-hydroxy acid dehydrogenase YdfG